MNRKKYGHLQEKIDKSSWKEHVAVALVDAYYTRQANNMDFPAGLLQGSFFNFQFPKALNFGGMGSVIGHEITHGFDDLGSQYDQDGNLRDWWEPETKETFRMRAKCIIDQYSSFKDDLTGLYLNGKVQQGENIADNAGVKEGFLAYGIHG